MIITREMILVIILAVSGTFVFFLISDNEVVMYALFGAAIIYVIVHMKKEKLIMEGV